MWMLPLGLAIAAPAPPVALDLPTTVHLGLRAQVLEARHAESGDGCEVAAAAALADLQKAAEKAGVPTLLSITFRDDGEGACRQRRTGDTVLQSVIHLDGIGIAEEPTLPSLAAERALTVLATLGAASGGLDGVTLTADEGAAWWRMEPGALTSEEGDPLAEAADRLVDEVFPLLGVRAAPLGSTTEVAGLERTFEAGKKKSYRALRVRVPTALATDYVRGGLTEEELLAGLVLHTQQGTGTWTPRQAGDVQLEDAGARHVQLRDVDMDDADLEGLEDEE